MAQFFDGITQIYDGIGEMIGGVNPLISTMDEPMNQHIAVELLQKGYTIEQIMNFVAVSTTQLEEFLDIELKVMVRLRDKTRSETRQAA